MLWFLLLLSACSRQGPPELRVLPGENLSPAGSPWPALALIHPGSEALWFELDHRGAGHIQDPSASALSPFEPWPLARHVTGLLLWEGRVVMAVNREGFLVLEPQEDGEPAPLILYRIEGAGVWDPYTAESLFLYQGRPAALLYRNDFFMDHPSPPPPSRVYALDPLSSRPLALSVPALDAHPSQGLWETEVVRRGPSGSWYIRMRDLDRGQVLFFRTEDLGQGGQQVGISEWIYSFPEEGLEEDPLYPFLPPLPEGFVYTHLICLEPYLVAAWEEQDEASIGAAGFMIVQGDFFDEALDLP